MDEEIHFVSPCGIMNIFLRLLSFPFCEIETEYYKICDNFPVAFVLAGSGLPMPEERERERESERKRGRKNV